MPGKMVCFDKGERTDMKLKILCIGDLVGRPGRRIVSQELNVFIKEHNIDCVIANGENAAGGSGITPQIYEKLLRYGVNLITLGDHAFRKREIIGTLESQQDISRPLNLSEHSAGRGYGIYKTAKGPVVGVANLIGRIFMKPADCPYSAIDKLLPSLNQKCDIVFVDMHAEATSEKIAMGHYLDGRVGCVFGTHTHVVTADEQILPKGTAYITDVGMTGPHESVLGRGVDSVLKSFRTGMPFAFEIAKNDIRINGIVVTVDASSKKAEHIERLRLEKQYHEESAYDSDNGKPQYLNDNF